MNKKCNNLWIVDSPDEITGLVHPETLEEAQVEMERLELTGTLRSRKDFEKSDRYRAIILGDRRASLKARIAFRANEQLGGKFSILRQLNDVVATLKPKVVPLIVVVDYAAAKMEWCDTADRKELSEYNPATDEDWPV